MNEDKEPEH